MNLHIIVGRIGHDPELKQLPSGTPVCNASIATDESYKDREGQQVKRTTWHRVTLFAAAAESFARHVRKGRSVAITGAVRRRTAEDNTGVEREYVDTVARTWEFAGSNASSSAEHPNGGQQASRDGNGQRGQQPRRGSPQNRPRQQPRQQPATEFEDDIPF